jgi:hypothetical protein
MEHRLKISQGELLRTLSGKECPFCETQKMNGCMFCDACYAKLPEDTKREIKIGLRHLSNGIRAGVIFLQNLK